MRQLNLLSVPKTKEKPSLFWCPDLVGLDEVTMFKLTDGMGGGMGGMEGTCGAVTGACLVASMKASSGNLEKPDSKAATYKLSREITRQFKEQNGSVTCKEIKGVETGKVLRVCRDCIRDAAALVEKIVFSED